MTELTLAGLGWSAHQQAECAGLDLEATPPMRLVAVERDRATALAPRGEAVLHYPGDRSAGDFAVGDWVLTEGGRIVALVARRTEVSRRAAGTGAARQLIAANVDLLVIVSSCNADFNPGRLERYLALAASAGAMPLIVLTKADEAEDPEAYARQARRLTELAAVETIDAREADEAARVAAWCRAGQTLALVGSSGVGKTTLLNSLTGRAEATAAIREDDAKGRHTTTRRSLVAGPGGVWVLDTPGMRALRLADAEDGIAEVFTDIAALAEGCRFSDCSHEGEPGCAVADAVAQGTLEARRLENWRKLRREEARNSETLAEARARDRAFGRMVRDAMAVKGRKDR